MWQAAILDREFYADLQKALGQTIHYPPAGAIDNEAGDRLENLYTGVFNDFPRRQNYGLRGPPATPISNPIHLFVKTVTNKTFKVIVDKNATVYDVKHAVKDSIGVPLDRQVLIHGGRDLGDMWPLRSYRIGDGAQVYLTLTFRASDFAK